MKIILRERRDYETLIITKMVMNEFKKSLVYLSEHPEEDEIKTNIDPNSINQLQDKLPKHFKLIELNVSIDEEMDGFNVNGSTGKFYSKKLKEFDSSSLRLNMIVNNNFSLEEYGNYLVADLKSLIRHELEHLYQKSTNIIPNPNEDVFKYYHSDEEVEAYIVQLVRYSKNGRHNFFDIFNLFLEDVKDKLEMGHKDHNVSRKIFSKLIEKELELIKNKMIKRLKEVYPKIYLTL